MKYFPQRLDRAAQAALLADLRRIIAEAPLFTPTMPRSGKPMSVRMTNCGPLGWVTDKERGYRYQATHPETGKPWPPIPRMLLDLWNEVGGYAAPPEACLVNYYAGERQDGAASGQGRGGFRRSRALGVARRHRHLSRRRHLAQGPDRRNIELKSGDVVVLGGEDRLAYHGIDRILPGTSDLLAEGGRFNLTLRRVTKPE